MYVKRDISILRDIFALSPVTDNIFQEHPRTGAFPTLTNVVITSEVFGVPPNAVQMGSASLLNTSDDRMQPITGAAITKQGYVASAGNFVFYPAIQASPNGSAAMVFTLSGPTYFASAAYALLSGEGHSFGPITIAALGSGPYDPQATRWGDYSYATVDPNGEGIWLATEYIPALSRQTVDGLRNWGTRVLEVRTRGE